MQYNYHCNRVVILNLELVQFWLFLAAFGTPLTRLFPIKTKPHKTFINIVSFEKLPFHNTLARNYFYLLIFTCSAGFIYESGMAIPHPWFMGTDILDFNNSRFDKLVTDWLVENMTLHKMLFDCVFFSATILHTYKRCIKYYIHLGFE